MLKKYSLKTVILDTLVFTGGSILYAIGLYTFARNANFAPGGLSGLALMINHYWALPIGITSFVLNIPLIIMAYKIVGSSFILKSIYTMIINIIFTDLIIPLFPTYSGSRLLAALFTGVLIGVGLALIYMRGSSTGGADFVTITVKKLHPHYSIGQITLVSDAVIIILSGFVYKDIDSVLYGVVSAYATTKMLDNVLYGAGGGKLAIIITNHGPEIAKAIDVEVARGSTLVEVTGTFTGLARDMVLCACAKSEIYKVRTAVRALDPHSMIMITEATEVIGEGFDPPQIPGSDTNAPASQKTTDIKESK